MVCFCLEVCVLVVQQYKQHFLYHPPPMICYFSGWSSMIQDHLTVSFACLCSHLPQLFMVLGCWLLIRSSACPTHSAETCSTIKEECFSGALVTCTVSQCSLRSTRAGLTRGRGREDVLLQLRFAWLECCEPLSFILSSVRLGKVIKELEHLLSNEMSTKQAMRRRGLRKYCPAQHCQLAQADEKWKHVKGSCSLLLLKQEGNVGATWKTGMQQWSGACSWLNLVAQYWLGKGLLWVHVTRGYQ